MKSNRTPNPLYTILLLYEDMMSNNSQVTEEDYLAYLDRIAIKYLGMGKMDIYHYIVGLRELGKDIEQSKVKAVVFHILGMEGGHGS